MLNCRFYFAQVLGLLILFLQTPLVAAAEQPGNAASTNPCHIPNSVVRTRPDADGPPTEVSIGVFIFDLFGVDETTQSFELDFVVIQTWLDPRLSVNALGSSLADCRLTIDDIWNPEIELVNQKNLRRDISQEAEISDEGQVMVAVSYSGELSSPLDLQKFPFDAQELPLHLVSFMYDTTELRLLTSEEWTGRLDSSSLGGWRLLETRTVNDVPAVRTVIGEHPRLDHVISVQRNSAFYIWKFTIPLCFIVLMAASVFWLNPETFANQIGISTASVFALVAYLVSLGNTLPQIEYLTNMDKMVFGSTALVFLAFGEVVVTSRLVGNNKSGLARRIDWHARWIFILLFSTLLASTMIFVG